MINIRSSDLIYLYLVAEILCPFAKLSVFSAPYPPTPQTTFPLYFSEFDIFEDSTQIAYTDRIPQNTFAWGPTHLSVGPITI